MSGLQSLDVTLVHADGELVNRRSLNVALHAACVLFKDGAKGAGSVADRDRGFVDFQRGDRECRELCRAAEEAGLAERAPDIKEVADTSDRFAHATLQVSHEYGSQTVRLTLMCSGYEGPDAPALKRFLALLLQAGGVRNEAVLRDLTE